MRIIMTLALAAVAAACGGRSTAQPVQLSGPAPAATGQTYDCVNRELARMGYTIAASDRQAGTIRGTHVNEAPWWHRILGIRSTFDQISATVTQGQLRVTAVSSDPAAAGEVNTGASAAAQRDAQHLLSTCGTG